MSNLTKKNYEAIAAIMNNHGAKCIAVSLSGLHKQTCNDLADYFAQDNRNFDRTRFLQACGIDTRQPSTIAMEQWARRNSKKSQT